MNNLGFGMVFSATDLASNVIRQVNTSFFSLDKAATSVTASVAKKLGVSTDVMVKSLKGVAIGAAVAAVGLIGLSTAFSLAGPAGKFEQNLAAVGAVTKATTAEMQLLEKAAIDAGIATQFSPTQAVEGLQSLATAGQSAAQATATLVPVLDLAAGSLGQLGVAGAAEAVVGTLNAYGASADQAAITTDKLLRITQLTNFQTRDFGSGLSKAASSMSEFGQNLDDVLIGMGLLRNRNIDASSSATALREATRRLGSDQRAQRAVTEIGVQIFDQQTGAMRSLLDIMGDFSVATKNLTEEERGRRVVQAFGARGLSAFGAVAKATFRTVRDGRDVTLQGAEAIKAMRVEMKNAKGTAASFRDALLDTFEGQKTLLTGTIETIKVAIGKPFAQVLKPIVGGVVDALNFLLGVLVRIPAPVKKFLAGLFVVGSVTALVVGLGLALKALLPIAIAIAIKTAVIWLPVAAAIAAVALGIAFVKKVIDRLPQEKVERFRRIWVKFTDLAVRIGSRLAEAFARATESLGLTTSTGETGFKALESTINQLIDGPIFQLLDRLADMAESFLTINNNARETEETIKRIRQIFALARGEIPFFRVRIVPPAAVPVTHEAARRALNVPVSGAGIAPPPTTGGAPGGAGAPGAAGAAGAGGLPTPAQPGPARPPQQREGLSREETLALIATAFRGGPRGGRAVFRGEVRVNGKAFAEVTAQEERDSAARRGQRARSNRR